MNNQVVFVPNAVKTIDNIKLVSTRGKTECSSHIIFTMAFASHDWCPIFIDIPIKWDHCFLGYELPWISDLYEAKLDEVFDLSPGVPWKLQEAFIESIKITNEANEKIDKASMKFVDKALKTYNERTNHENDKKQAHAILDDFAASFGILTNR